uniref:Ribosome binding factor A n=1 Tax=Callorhinchus milii TaxID=7868 RepID=A0A4W3IIN5_CALMI
SAACIGKNWLVWRLYKPSSLENLLKPLQKTKKDDTIRKRTLNNVFHKAIAELFSTHEISPEVYDLNVEISKVLLTSDFSACRVYWITSGVADKDDHIQQVLERNAARIRHLLITHQVKGNIPSVVFVRDKEFAIVSEVERLLELADFASTAVLSDLPPTHNINLFGIDHDLLNKQILDYKKRSSEKLFETKTFALAEQQQEQLALLRKLKRIKKKKTKYGFDDDITPERFLSEKYNAETRTRDVFSDGEKELKGIDEEINELETDDEEDRK